METIRFTIPGNQEDPHGNPIGYVRSTQGSKWNPRYQRYCSWKDYVRAIYFDMKYPDKEIKREDFGEAHDMLTKRIFMEKGLHGSVVASIYFGDETHGDPDNIVKGLLDTFFADDKHIDVQTFHECRSERPRVEVLIKIN